VLVGLEVIHEIKDQMQSIRKRIKEVQDQNKSYAYAHSIDRNYEVGDEVFLRVKPHKSSFKFGKVDKLSPSFFGPFKVVEKKDPWLTDYPYLIF
jgi:hypothetical protein